VGKYKLIWKDFFNCKIIVVCRTEEEINDFSEKRKKYSKDFKKEEIVFYSEECTGIIGMNFRYNFWFQKKETEFNIKDYIFVYWSEVMNIDKKLKEETNSI